LRRQKRLLLPSCFAESVVACFATPWQRADRLKRGKCRGEISAQHVQRAVRQVDQIHDAEDQGQAGCKQEQQHAQLNTVETLLKQIQHCRYVTLNLHQA